MSDSMIKVIITSARGIIHLANQSRGQQKTADPSILKEVLHPEGRNLLYYVEDVTSDIIRTQWFVQLKESDNPEPLWLDVKKSEIDVVGTLIELDASDARTNTNILGAKRKFSDTDADQT